MTWKEFKEEVDRQLKEKNLDEDTRIGWIDWPSGYDEDSVDVRGGEEMLTISS